MNVDYYFDFSCPYAYLGSAQLEEVIADRATLRWRPMLLGGVFRAIGAGDGPMATMSPAKAEHNRADLQRWATHFGVPLTSPPNHPMKTVRALRALLALPEAQWPAFIKTVFEAYWVHGAPLAELETIRACLERAGVDPALRQRALDANDEPAIKDELRQRTDDAVGRGIFGAPTIFVETDDGHQHMFWGQDRLHMVDAVLSGWRPTADTPPVADSKPVADAPPAPRRPAVQVDFWFDFSSPFAYLASTQIESFEFRTGAQVTWKPMLLGALFRDIGQVMVPLQAMPACKQRYVALELDHWKHYWQVELEWPSRFPMNTVKALRLALQAGNQIAPLSRALFEEYWRKDGDLTDDETLRRVVCECGLDADALLSGTRDASVKSQLRDATDSARSAGVFGAPTFVTHLSSGPALYWGQDRLALVEEALANDR